MNSSNKRFNPFLSQRRTLLIKVRLIATKSKMIWVDESKQGIFEIKFVIIQPNTCLQISKQSL